MKRKRCEKKLVSCLLLACLFIGAAVYGAVGSGIAVTNHFQTGSVDLELKTYRKSADGIQRQRPEGTSPLIRSFLTYRGSQPCGRIAMCV